jgi:ATP-dependent RNA helicase RhlE
MNTHKTNGAKRSVSSFVSKNKRGGKPKMGKIFGSRVRYKEVASSSQRNQRKGGGNSRNRSRGRGGEKIDVSKFIRKAEPLEQEIVYTPKHLFSDFNLLPEIKAVIKSRGFEKPSPVQDQTIPASLQGQDVLGIANTGTGKTAAFLLPIIDSLLKNKKQKALILAPTRELALQIEKEFRAFTHRDMKLFSVSLVGGAPLGPQQRELSRGVHIIIGTPGRVQDMIRRGYLKLETISHMVLDEVDQMLDMGFVDEISNILNLIPKNSQKYFFSATLEPRISNLIYGFLENPARVIL